MQNVEVAVVLALRVLVCRRVYSEKYLKGHLF